MKKLKHGRGNWKNNFTGITKLIQWIVLWVKLIMLLIWKWYSWVGIAQNSVVVVVEVASHLSPRACSGVWGSVSMTLNFDLTFSHSSPSIAFYTLFHLPDNTVLQEYTSSIYTYKYLYILSTNKWKSVYNIIFYILNLFMTPKVWYHIAFDV